MFRKYLSNLRIAQRFMLVISPALVVLLVSGCLLFDRYISRKLTDSYEKSVSILADSFHESVKGSLERGQMKNFQKLLSNQLNIEGVMDVSLFNKEGHLDMSSSASSGKDLQLDQEIFDQAKDKKVRFTRTNGSQYQVITPQVTTSDCIRCHQGWQIDELGGIISLSYDLTRLQEAIKNQRLFLTYGCAALVFLITCLLFVVTRSVTKPIVTMTGVMQQLAENDLSVTIPGENRNDEIGAMGSAVNVFKQNAQKKDELEKALAKMADSFEGNVGSILTSVLSELGNIQKAVHEVSTSAKSTNALSTSVVASSTTTAANVQSVATAIQEMNTTNSDINAQVELAADISTKAVQQTITANDSVQRFARNADEIEQVVKLISDIAEQTNLLALNATIEAARAGDAGRGFAVVASEVKELAAQTKRATTNIAEKIGAIQSASTESVDSIKNVTTVLTDINEIAMTIAHAVNQQQQANNEIAENMHSAALESEGVSRNLADVVLATEKTGQSAKTVQEKVDNLTQQTDTLKENLNDFLKHVRQIG